MSAFAGIIALDGASIGRRREESLWAIVGRHGAARPRAQRSASAIIVQNDTPVPAGDPGVLFASSVRLDNRDAIAAATGLGAGAGDALLIQRHFETCGDRGIAQFLGAFAFAHWHEAAGRLTLARDCEGARSLFFHRGNGFVAVASLLADLLAIPEVPRELDETMMANFIALDLRQTSQTFYRGIDRVASRTVVEISAQGTKTRHYWSPRLDAPPPYTNIDDYVARARELFDVAVRRCIGDLPRLAISTSGGLDSSAIAATAARLGHPDITCYTCVPTDDLDLPENQWTNRYLDERPKVDALARMYPFLRIRYLAPAKAHAIEEDPRRIFVQAAVPLRNISNMSWFSAIPDTIIADGHDVLVDGNAGNFGLTWTGAFSLTALARDGRYAELLRQARAVARNKRRPLWRVLAGETILKRLPRSAQRFYTRLRIGDPDDVSGISLLRTEARDALGLRQIWEQDGFDPYYRMVGSATRFRAHHMFDQNQLARDLRAMYPENSGYEMRDPHADRELLEFCLSVPEWLYRKDGVERWFARQVFADRLPPEILNEQRRGMQVPNWFDFLNARKDAIAEEVERMEASPMTCRLIDVPRAKQLIAEWPKDAHEAQNRQTEYCLNLDRAVHVGQFIRWVEGGNA